MEKSENWAQRTQDHMLGIKNTVLLASLSWVNVFFITWVSVLLKKHYWHILASFHFKFGTYPSFLRYLWKQRRQWQNTEGWKLAFFLLLNFRFRFITVREFPTSHWHLVLPCPVSLKEKVPVAICMLMLTSYQNPAEQLIPSPGATVVLEKRRCNSAPGHFSLNALQFPITLSLHTLACS